MTFLGFDLFFFYITFHSESFLFIKIVGVFFLFEPAPLGDEFRRFP